MAEIIPAVMPESLADLEAHLAKVSGLASTVQVDVMDGKYVPEKTWPYKGEAGAFEEMASEARGLPLWEDFEYEIDLMVDEPGRDSKKWISAGASRIVIHIEHKDSVQVLQALFAFEAVSKEERNVQIGVAITSDTELSRLNDILPEVNFVQCMGIKRIGYQGEPFDERVLERLVTLREWYPNLILSVDGAVNEETLPKLIQAGANRFITQSAIFGSENPRESLRRLKEL